jgi:hypothetical protein
LIVVFFLVAAAVSGVGGETFQQAAYLAIGFFMYLTRQGVSLCVTTILQQDVEDTYRGRVFAFYDMLYNAMYAAGAAVFAAFMPSDGRSAAIVAVCAVGFAVAAAAYWLAAGGSSGDGGTSMPSADAQRSSS